MMYAFTRLDDGTEVVYSDAYEVRGTRTVKVYFEKPIYRDLKSAECYLPKYEWMNIHGFSEEEISRLQEYIKSVSHTITRLAAQTEQVRN